MGWPGTFSGTPIDPSPQPSQQGAVTYSPFNEERKIRATGLPPLDQMIRNAARNLHPLTTTFPANSRGNPEDSRPGSNQATPSPGLSSGTAIPGQYAALEAWSHDEPRSALALDLTQQYDMHCQVNTSATIHPDGRPPVFHPSVLHTSVESQDYQPFIYSDPTAPIGRQHMNPFHHSQHGGIQGMTVELEVDFEHMRSVSSLPRFLTYRRADGSLASFQVDEAGEQSPVDEPMEDPQQDGWDDANQRWVSR
ncbi:hypothetical protein M231_03284 [Tremella mesenterica]|uniref:Uncharacterized protein n=1 Tax=Tremella mesenterica TaxID=5217 RepID=A0A4Q1BNK8_TREME|nr:hypothetical protein M231_03284 [Tremella mesenterica]